MSDDPDYLNVPLWLRLRNGVRHPPEFILKEVSQLEAERDALKLRVEELEQRLEAAEQALRDIAETARGTEELPVGSIGEAVNIDEALSECLGYADNYLDAVMQDRQQEEQE